MAYRSFLRRFVGGHLQNVNLILYQIRYKGTTNKWNTKIIEQKKEENGNNEYY